MSSLSFPREKEVLLSTLQRTIQDGDIFGIEQCLVGQDDVTMSSISDRNWGLLLTSALQSGNSDVISLLSRYGQDVIKREIDVNTILCQIITGLKCDVTLKQVLPLLPLPLDLRSARLRGKPALHLAARHDNHGAILPLIEHGCDVMAKDDIHGDTALHVACFYGNMEAAFTLLQSGAHLNVLNTSHETPLDRLLSLCSQPSKNSMERARLTTALCLWKMGFRVNPQDQGHGHRRGQRQKILQHFRKERSSCRCLPTLQHLCRLDIRSLLLSSLSLPTPTASLSSLCQSVEQLHGLPGALKRFLLFQPTALNEHVLCHHVKSVFADKVT